MLNYYTFMFQNLIDEQYEKVYYNQKSSLE